RPFQFLRSMRRGFRFPRRNLGLARSGPIEIDLARRFALAASVVRNWELRPSASRTACEGRGTLPSAHSVRQARRSALWWIAITLAVLGAGLRFWEISWGTPERIGLHPDEAEHVMSHALAISLADPDPHFLNYPSFLIYLIALVNGGFSRLGIVTEPWQSYVVARSIVASFGTLTIPAVFWLGLELGGSALAAGLGGLYVALLPLHVWESHFAVTDVVMTFWIVVVLAGSLRLLRCGELTDHLLVGAALGLAVASKYT